MKPSACLLLSSALTWVLCNPVTAVKFTQEDLAPENVNESLSTALILRSSRGAEEVNRSEDRDLDAVVSAKVFDSIAGGFEDLGKALGKVGLKAGEAAGNAAIVVGDHVIEAAKAHVDSLPLDIKQMADDLGRTAKSMANGIKDAGKTLEQGVVDLADDALVHAQGLADQGQMLATQVGTQIGNDIAAAAHAVGDSVKELEKLGPLAMAIAKETWDQIKKFVNCLDDNGLMCPILLGDRCDCPSGSSVRFDGGELVLKCIVGKSAGFGMGFGFKAQPGGKFGGKKAGKLQLPGELFEEKKAEVKQAFKKYKGGLKNKMSAAPTGSCETSIDMAIEGHVQNALTFEMSTSGPKSTITISGAIGVSLDGMIKAQGSCKLAAEKRFPKVPKKKIVCYKAFCVVIMVQMVAQLEVNGVLTGTVEMGAEVGFDISGSVTLDKTTGKATAEFKAPSVDRQAAFAMGASAFASVRLGAGPFIVIYPVPGVPVNFNPMLNLELRAQGDIKYGPAGLFLIQEPEASPPSNFSLVAGSETYQDAVSSKSSSGSSMLKLCAAAALNIYIDTGITAFGLPVGFDFSFTPRDIIKELMSSFTKGATMALQVLNAGMGCVPGLDKVSDVATKGLKKAAETAADTITSIIPDLNLDFSGKPVALAVDKVFCVEAYTTPGFSTSPCARELGCKHVGRLPSSDAEITRILPKKEAMPSVKKFIDKRQLIHEIGLGENFIELGNFRLGAIDDTHFSISHCTGNVANRQYKPWNMHGQGVTVEPDWVACQKRCKSVVGCAHFTFWPSGNCRLQNSGALSYFDAWSGITGPPSHSQAKCTTIQIWRADGTNHYDVGSIWGAWRDAHGNLRPRTPSGHSVGIHFGFEFIQIGQFRLGAADDTHFTISHSNGNTNEIFRDDGLVCCGGYKDFGTWDRPVGAPVGISYGDRFLQLGDFRIADEEGVRFVISNVKKKKIIQVFDSRDGKLHPNNHGGYTTFSNVNRAPAHYTVKDIGVTAFGPCDPEFAAFGDRFIQLGNWRMGIFDDRHFTIAHRDGRTPEILTSDGVVHANFPSSIFNTWNRPLGYPSGIVFGHQFIQMGNWRVAAIDDTYLSISHKDGQTSKIYSSTGDITHGPTTAHNAWSRPIGAASGVTFGDRFIQIGKFRIGDADGLHLATTYISGVPGGTSLFLHAHWGWCGTINKHVYGPTVNARHAHWHCGGLQANMGSCPGIVTGDDFMQIGQWRLAADGATFSVSHIDGQAKTFSAGSLLQTKESVTEAIASTMTSLLHVNDSLMVADVWSRQPMAAASNKRVRFGDRVIQIGQWRLGEVDGKHFTISHSSLKTLVIYRSNSANDPNPVFPGARPEWGLWGSLPPSRNPPMDESMGVSFGDRFVQIGNFRLGDVDGKHFSVAHAGTGKTLMVFQSDGNHGHHHCPRDDFTTLGRPMEQCQVMEP